MSDTDKLFAAGLSFVENSQNVKLSTETKLRFYGLYKCAAQGKNSTSAPSKLKIVEYKKWSAWKTCSDQIFSGSGSEEELKTAAKVQYLKELNKAVPGWDKQQAKL